MGGTSYGFSLSGSALATMQFLSDKQFLACIHSYERQLAKLLALLLAIVIGFAVIELVVESSIKIAGFQTDWFDGGLIKLLDRLLLIFIALEVLQNVTAYLRDQVVQIELVLLTAHDRGSQKSDCAAARHGKQTPTYGGIWGHCGGPGCRLLAGPTGQARPANHCGPA